LLNKVDIEVTLPESKGEIGNAGAIRYGISRGLCHFVDADMKEKMKLG
jgi:ribosomal protein S9